MPIREEIVYFEELREENTEEVLRVAKEYAEKHGIRSIVVASTRGRVAEAAVKYFDPSKYNLVVVTHTSWFREGVKQEFDPEIRRKLEEKGVKFVTAAHATGGINRAVRGLYGGWSIGDLVADTLRIFGEGFKVAVEIAAMAADAGVVDVSEDIISIAGTGRGADTALVVQPAPSRRFFNIKVKKILAKALYFRR